jgi:hypothetical protein
MHNQEGRLFTAIHSGPASHTRSLLRAAKPGQHIAPQNATLYDIMTVSHFSFILMTIKAQQVIEGAIWLSATCMHMALGPAGGSRLAVCHLQIRRQK